MAIVRVVASVKRKKSIELSMGEFMPFYTRAPWKSMEVYGLEIPVASENSCMSLREPVSQFGELIVSATSFQAIVKMVAEGGTGIHKIYLAYATSSEPIGPDNWKTTARLRGVSFRAVRVFHCDNFI